VSEYVPVELKLIFPLRCQGDVHRPSANDGPCQLERYALKELNFVKNILCIQAVVHQGKVANDVSDVTRHRMAVDDSRMLNARRR